MNSDQINYESLLEFSIPEGNYEIIHSLFAFFIAHLHQLQQMKMEKVILFSLVYQMNLASKKNCHLRSIIVHSKNVVRLNEVLFI